MQTFSFSINQSVIFEAGAIKKAADIVSGNNYSRVLIISGRPLDEVGIVKKLTDALEEKNITYDTFLDVEANPTVGTVEKSLQAFIAFNAECLIALGGGSAMDTAKIVGTLAKYGGQSKDYSNYYDDFKPVPGKIVPVIAIATTAGTGSESTCTAVVTDPEKGYKFAVTSPYLLPEYAILDPEMITGIPQKLAAPTGMDALVHAIETYLSVKATPFTDAMAEKAMELIGRNIKRFSANRKNIEAASAMMLGSNFAAQAFTKAWLGDVHAMAHPLGGFCNVTHGVACSILLPIVLEFNALADAGKYQKIYELITGEKVDKFEPSILVDYVKRLIYELGIPAKLSEVGVDKNLIHTMAVDAMKSGNIYNNPRQATLSDIEGMYLKAY